jgi:pimeloyl-ACP methyl ester carboxylesterase
MTLTDPYDARFEVPVAGGRLHVARAGPPPDQADAVVLAIHGLTSSLMAWRTVARRLAEGGRVCLLAPDLRGRGRSATLGGPFGFGAHIADLLAVLDHVGVQTALVAGHSLGAYVGSYLAAQHPERTSGVVLVDSGLPFRDVPKVEPAELVEQAFGAAIGRLRMTFPSVEDYVERWRLHPAFARLWQPGFAQAWDEDVEAFARYDVAGEPGAVRCIVSQTAVLADSREILLDESTRMALAWVSAPVHLLRASRGVHGYDQPLIARQLLQRFLASRPDANVEQVPGANHYTLILGPRPGPRRVAAAIERATHPSSRAARHRRARSAKRA